MREREMNAKGILQRAEWRFSMRAVSVQVTLSVVSDFATPWTACERAIQLALIGGSQKTSQSASGRPSEILDVAECIERSILWIGESLIISASSIKHIMN